MNGNVQHADRMFHTCTCPHMQQPDDCGQKHSLSPGAPHPLAFHPSRSIVSTPSTIDLWHLVFNFKINGFTDHVPLCLGFLALYLWNFCVFATYSICIGEWFFFWHKVLLCSQVWPKTQSFCFILPRAKISRSLADFLFASAPRTTRMGCLDVSLLFFFYSNQHLILSMPQAHTDMTFPPSSKSLLGIYIYMPQTC